MSAPHLHEPSTGRPGHVAFVGAGPGDPDLLTVKALRALGSADVVIHDRLITADILDLARDGAVMIEAGKQGYGPSRSQADINAMIVRQGGRAGRPPQGRGRHGFRPARR